jgi:hypothetical protein
MSVVSTLFLEWLSDSFTEFRRLLSTMSNGGAWMKDFAFYQSQMFVGVDPANA